MTKKVAVYVYVKHLKTDQWHRP